MQELLNVSKNPKSIFYSVRLKSRPTTFEEIRNETKDLKANTVKCLSKTIKTITMENYAWRPVFHKMFNGLDENEEVLKIEMDRRTLIAHDITPWDLVQKIPSCEIDPRTNFLYVPKHTDLSTLIKGNASIVNVGYADVGNEWELTIESHRKRFRKILVMDITDPLRTCSSNVWDIYETLGIEAVREYLLQELMSETSHCKFK